VCWGPAGGTCAIDAGACSGPAPDIACSIGCSGEYGPPECIDGDWQCPPVPPCPPPPPDAGFDAGTFACGSLSCDPTKTYCQISEGGAALPDGGAKVSVACIPIPATCDDSNTATCACVQALQGVGGCPCKEGAKGQVTVTCQYP